MNYINFLMVTKKWFIPYVILFTLVLMFEDRQSSILITPMIKHFFVNNGFTDFSMNYWGFTKSSTFLIINLLTYVIVYLCLMFIVHLGYKRVLKQELKIYHSFDKSDVSMKTLREKLTSVKNKKEVAIMNDETVLREIRLFEIHLKEFNIKG